VAAFLGCAYAGAIPVPCYPPHARQLAATLERAEGIAAESTASLALTTSEAFPLLATLGEAAPRLSALRWMATDGPECARPADWRPPNSGPDDVAFIQYTSGSTTTPRGVVVGNDNLMANLRAMHTAAGPTGARTSVFWLPPFHDMGLVTLLHALTANSSHVSMAPQHFLQRPARWLAALSRYHGSISGAPNFAFELCLRRISDQDMAGLDLRDVEVIFCGAEPVRVQTMERFAARFRAAGLRPEALTPVYGLAEATLYASGTKGRGAQAETVRLSDLAEGRAVPVPRGASATSVVNCGAPPDEHEIAIVGQRDGAVLPDGEIGEIWCAGPSVARGYWHQPTATEAVFGAALPGGDGERKWLRTGDLGYLRGGDLFVTGRIKDLLIIRGRNYYPHDLEQSAQGSDQAIRPGGVAVFTVPAQEALGTDWLVVVCETTAGADEERVTSAVRTAVARDHDLWIDHVLLVAPRSILKTSSGKIRRLACRDAYLADALSAFSPTAPEDGPPGGKEAAPENPPPAPQQGVLPANAEEWLVRHVAQATGTDPTQVPRDRPLSELGFDSVRSAELTAALSAWLGRPVRETLIWEYPTISAIASSLGGQQTEESVDFHHTTRGETVAIANAVSLDAVLTAVEAMDEAEVASRLAAPVSRDRR
jgi:acyl-CoA synthetase (AMP-forming)/AMP-acid ligase II/acyl carrier protein